MNAATRKVLLLGLVPALAPSHQEPTFRLEQVLGYPYPSELAAAPNGAAVAWVLNERGARNVWEAEAPDWTPHRLTNYLADDGQELTHLAFTPDGKGVIYVRGGDHGANWPAEGGLAPDPGSSPLQPKVEIWAVQTSAVGAAPRLLAEGDEPAISPRGDRVAFLRNDQVWVVPFDGSKPAGQLFFTRGANRGLAWAPDGSRLAFVSDRGDHSFIGLFTSDSAPIRYVAPSTSRDFNVRWSPDGRRFAFLRRPGQGGPPEPFLELRPQPWAIWVADATSGSGHEVWHSPNTLHGSLPTTAGGANLAWAGDRLAFLADLDGWPHLYSVPIAGGTPLLLTAGAFMVEHVAVTPDHRYLVYSANTGPDTNDVDRRHLFRVRADRPGPSLLTSGTGIEWTPVVTGDGQAVAFVSADAQRPPLPAVMPLEGGRPRLLGADRIPADFPTTSLVVPRKVLWRAPDGTPIHGQLFVQPGREGKQPGIVFVHGGPPRQMLLGWHYMEYYANAYAVNQYLASRGYVVLAVNYRLGIGYGHDFHHPLRAGPRGAAEYQDVLAGGRFLGALPQVDPRRVGIWGGSYGGYLTALALARNSDVFTAGVDVHGVHDWVSAIREAFTPPAWRYERGDLDSARATAWRASPVATIETWKSPVLLMHGDDDRNVRFSQTVDLVRRLDAARIPYQELVLPDEIHDFLRHRSWMTVDSATVAYFGAVFGAR